MYIASSRDLHTRRKITSRIYKCPFITVTCAKKSGMETKACVSAIYAARSNGVIAIFYHSSASALLRPEISLVNGESSLSIKAVLIGAGMCVSTVAFKYRWEE